MRSLGLALGQRVIALRDGVGDGFHGKYFPPIAGHDSHNGSVKFLNVYFHNRGFNLHPLMGLSFKKEGYFYLWPLYRVSREGGELHTSSLWAAFRNRVWSEPWERAEGGACAPYVLTAALRTAMV